MMNHEVLFTAHELNWTQLTWTIRPSHTMRSLVALAIDLAHSPVCVIMSTPCPDYPLLRLVTFRKEWKPISQSIRLLAWLMNADANA